MSWPSVVLLVAALVGLSAFPGAAEPDCAFSVKDSVIVPTAPVLIEGVTVRTIILPSTGGFFTLEPEASESGIFVGSTAIVSPDFDVGFYRDGNLISIFDGPGAEAGVVPHSADTAVVTLQTPDSPANPDSDPLGTVFIYTQPC